MILKEVNVNVSDVVEILDNVEFREGNMNIYKLIFNMSQELMELVSVAVFTTQEGETYKTAIIDGICYVPFDALKYGTTKLGVYSYKENELIHSPAPTDFFVGKGSYVEGSLTEDEFALSDYERYLILNQQILDEIKECTSRLDEADKEKLKSEVIEEIQPTLDNNLQEAKKYSDDIRPTKTSELTNDSNFAKTNENNNFNTAQTINGTLTINGDIVQNGKEYESHAEQVYTKKDEIILRDGAVGGMSADQFAGLLALLYNGIVSGRLGFKADGTAYVGDVGDEQPLLTRDDVLNLQDGQVLVWDAGKLRAIGSSDFIKNTDFASNSKAGVISASSKLGLNVSQTNGLMSIVEATEEQIAERTNKYNPITPNKLDYAVGSVKASESQSGTIKAWTSSNDDGEIGLNISTEV